METAKKNVSFKTMDRQWDARFNVQTDEDLDALLAAARAEWDTGRLRYVLIGGLEVGTRPNQDDYQIRHVHACIIYHNRVSKSSILNNWKIKQGNGYYLVPRNRDLPYSGWRNHHIKEFSKVDPSKCILFEEGTLPADEGSTYVRASTEEKKRKIDEVLIEMRTLIEADQDQLAFERFPRNYLMYGEKLKALTIQKKAKLKHDGPSNPHIWLHGFAGTGKTALLSYIYPTAYKKHLGNKWWDLYDDKIHTHTILEDLDYTAMDKLGINFLKTICDEAGFSIDQKYKTPQLTRTTCLITSNYTIPELLMDIPGREQAIAALSRRFWHVRCDALQQLLQIKLKPAYEVNRLKKEGNQDPGKLFIAWDHLTNSPLGENIKTPEEYQQIIRDAYYGKD